MIDLRAELIPAVDVVGSVDNVSVGLDDWLLASHDLRITAHVDASAWLPRTPCPTPNEAVAAEVQSLDA